MRISDKQRHQHYSDIYGRYFGNFPFQKGED